jgi:hypothetical protein
MFDLMQPPAELWGVGDQRHMVTARGGEQPDWARDSHTMGVDWIGDRFREDRFERAGQGPLCGTERGGTIRDRCRPKEALAGLTGWCPVAREPVRGRRGEAAGSQGGSPVTGPGLESLVPSR